MIYDLSWFTIILTFCHHIHIFNTENPQNGVGLIRNKPWMRSIIIYDWQWLLITQYIERFLFLFFFFEWSFGSLTWSFSATVVPFCPEFLSCTYSVVITSVGQSIKDEAYSLRYSWSTICWSKYFYTACIL